MNPANILAKAKNFAKPSETDHMDPGRIFLKRVINLVTLALEGVVKVAQLGSIF